MPGEPDYEARIAALEDAVRRLQEQAVDAVAARVLAAGADRDVSEVRAELREHTKALTALREVQVEHGQRLDRLDQKVDALDAKVTDGFGALTTSVDRIMTLVERLAGDS